MPQSGNSQETVLVTGASGCVGTFLVEELLDAGHRVIATDRPEATAPAPRANLVWRPADLTDPSGAAALVKGATGVIHTAAVVEVATPFEDQAPINLFAVRYLYDAAKAEGVSHFLHFSTGSLYAPKDGPLNEDDPLIPTSPYERTKLLAEDYLRTRTEGPIINIVRPALIYGPRGRVLLAGLATLPALLRRLDGRIPRLTGGPRTNLIHSRDVARAAAYLFQLRSPNGSTFNLAPPEILSAGEILATVLRTAGLAQGRPDMPYPGRLAAALLPLMDYAAPFAVFNFLTGNYWNRLMRAMNLDGGLAPRLDREAAMYLGADAVFDTSRLTSTGFTFRYPTFEAGWSDTFSWYVDNNWVPSPEREPPQTRSRAQAYA